MLAHEIQWTSPSPLWLEATATDGSTARTKMLEPAILRFAADSFMEDFLKIVETDPDAIRSLVAIKETWRGPSEKPAAEGLLAPAEPQSSFSRKLARIRLIADRGKNSGSLVSALKNLDVKRAAPLKLYQPAHQRYYLVTGCLVCGLPGLPDHAVNAARNEKVSFVIRRMLPPTAIPKDQNLPDVDMATWDEYAWVTSPDGATWQKVAKVAGATPPLMLPGEERLPLFPANYAEDDGRNRRVFSGLVPVGKREAYMAAPLAAATPTTPAVDSGATAPDPRMLLVWTQVTEPWKQLIAQAAKALDGLNVPLAAPFDDQSLKNKANATTKKSARERIQVASWYILLDFAKFLNDQLPKVISSLAGVPVTSSGSETIAVRALVSALQSARISTALANDLMIGTTYSTVPESVADALLLMLGGPALDAQAPTRAAAIENKLESVTAAYNRTALDAPSVWASFLFPLADVNTPNSSTIAGPFPPAGPGPINADPVIAAQDRIDHLSDLIQAALPSLPADTPLPALPVGMETPLDPREGWFVMRCAFERPNCGPLEPAIVSAPTRPFQMAGFFDPDAPARPIRIALPVDTTTAGLRKFDKKAAFMISDTLCGQIDRMKGVTLGDLVLSVLPFPFHKDLSVPEKGPCTSKDGLQAGMICSLSIPIITICALLMLMIIVSLLDFIFRWMPFFLICFPLPGFKAKKT